MPESRRLLDATKLIYELMSDLWDEEWYSYDSPHYWMHGSIQQRPRVARVADWCANQYPGDLVEIGCLDGATTAMLAEIAVRYGRKVWAIDPWEIGTQECQQDTRQNFFDTVAKWGDTVKAYQVRSDNRWIVEKLKSLPLCFAFVDGLHKAEALAIDIDTVAECNGIICVDDVLYEASLRGQFVMKAKRYDRAAVSNVHWREGYLV